jgi:hypothetical protein
MNHRSTERGSALVIALALVTALAVLIALVALAVSRSHHHRAPAVPGYSDCDRGDLREHDTDCGYSAAEHARCKAWLKRHRSCPSVRRSVPPRAVHRVNPRRVPPRAVRRPAGANTPAPVRRHG